MTVDEDEFLFVLQSSKDQRLVYSGRLLQDHLQLRDVLRKVCVCDCEYVCPVFRFKAKKYDKGGCLASTNFVKEKRQHSLSRLGAEAQCF